MKIVCTTFLAAVMLTVAQPGHSRDQAFTLPEAITATVANFAGVGTADVGPIDSRLRLAPCRQALLLGWHDRRGRTVTATCPDAGGWRLFVSIASGQAAAVSGPAAVAPGDAVTIHFTGRGFGITATGRALTAGKAGATVNVRPDGSKGVLRARVQSAGHVVAEGVQ
ncbi:flagella basal body P-ring formation protein FlgA [Porphyrobacter sp. GA68]|uniref:flagella basal body P-ring formation protein FlgA n=1 Tax=Porphyrobacter sp. GA68 TaxID=2883480 RepID=UPI001D1861C8|nr:flagella basal body P-ring formation protein FlgA [Porphyrobacter sp. GA68]